MEDDLKLEEEGRLEEKVVDEIARWKKSKKKSYKTPKKLRYSRGKLY